MKTLAKNNTRYQVGRGTWKDARVCTSSTAVIKRYPQVFLEVLLLLMGTKYLKIVLNHVFSTSKGYHMGRNYWLNSQR